MNLVLQRGSGEYFPDSFSIDFYSRDRDEENINVMKNQEEIFFLYMR